MRLLLIALVSLGLIVATVDRSHADRAGDAAAVAAIAIGALAVGALAASANNNRYPNQRPYAPVQPAYGAAFSPAQGVTCYPNRAICLRNNGQVATAWTRRLYNR